MKRVTLSFDNGPDPAITPQVLDVLAAHEILATFFMIGEKVAAPGGFELAKAAHDAGHWIGNHTYTHGTPLGQNDDPSAPEVEIGQTQRALGALSNKRRLFRPFGGGGHLDSRILSPAARDYLLEGGYTVVTWNCVPGDWKDPAGWPETALAEIGEQDWSLVVLHDIPGASLERLDEFISMIKADGFDIVQDFPPSCVPIEQGVMVRPDALPTLAA